MINSDNTYWCEDGHFWFSEKANDLDLHKNTNE